MHSFNILFLHKLRRIETKEKITLILSPAYYWFQKENLNITMRQAKKIAPSIFEGTIPPGEYSYFVQKCDDGFCFYAYEEKKILKALKDAGIAPGQVKRVYAAQMVFANLKEPIMIEDLIIASEDGTVVVLPKNIAAIEAKKADLSTLQLPKKSLPVRLYASDFISHRYMRTVIAILLIAIFLYALEFYRYNQVIKQLEAKEEAVKERYGLPPTTLQLQSILAKYEKVQKEQLALRETLAYILRTPLQPGEYFQKLDLGKKIRLEIHINSKNRAEAIKKYLAQKLHKADFVVSNDRLFVEAIR